MDSRKRKPFRIKLIITYRNTEKGISQRIFNFYFKNKRFYEMIEKIINAILF